MWHQQKNKEKQFEEAIKSIEEAGFDGFLMMIGVIILMSYFLPQAGMIKESISVEKIASGSISLIYFFYDLRLSV